jgi:hypothetical protein
MLVALSPLACAYDLVLSLTLVPARLRTSSVRRGAHIGICLDPVVPPLPVVVFTSAFAHVITVHSDSLMRELFDEKLV